MFVPFRKIALSLAVLIFALACEQPTFPGVFEDSVNIPLLAKGGGEGKNGVTTWQVPGDFATIEVAIANANAGDWIMVGPGTFTGAVVDKVVHIKGVEDAVIDDGPPAYGFTQGFQLLSGLSGLPEIAVCGLMNFVHHGRFPNQL